MRSARICEVIVLAAGVLILVGGLAHTFVGWPALRAEMTAQNVTQEVIRPAGIGWMFGGAAMDLLGILTLVSYSMLRSGLAAGRTVAVLIGGFYALFGVGAWAVIFPRAHFVPFVVVGVLLLVAAAAWRQPA